MNNWKTSKKERTMYGLYFMGQNMLYVLIFLFLTTYLLMSGLGAVETAGVLLVVKVWDAVNDCIFGGLIDKIHFKKGKFLPWLKLSLPLVIVTTIFLFRIPQSFGVNEKILWFAIAYILWDTAYTICDVPIFGLVTTMTDIQDERTSLMTTGRIFANVGVLLSMMCGYVLPSESIGLSFSNTALVVCLVAAISMFGICVSTKEHAYDGEKNEDYSIKKMFSYLVHNKYLLVYYGGLLLFTGLNTSATVLQFTSFYLFNNSLIATIIAALSFAPAIVVAFFMPFLLKRIDKFKLFYISAIIYVILSVVIWIIGPVLWVHLTLAIIRGFVYGVISVLQFMFTPDCAEYGQYMTGTDAKGITFAIQTFTMKLVSAIASVLAIGILGVFGWNSVAAESFAELAELNVAQSETALTALWNVYALVPTIGALLAVLIWHKYNLKTEDVEAMALFNNGEIGIEECDKRLSHSYGRVQ